MPWPHSRERVSYRSIGLTGLPSTSPRSWRHHEEMGRTFLGWSFPEDGRAAMEGARREEPSQVGRLTITSAPVTKLLHGRKCLYQPNRRHHKSQ